MTPRSAALMIWSMTIEPAVSKCHRKVWKSMLSEALSIARSRQSKAPGPSFSKPCQFPPAALPTVSQIAVCAGGGVYSGGSSIGFNDEQPATNRAKKIRQYDHRAGVVRELVIFIMKSMSLIRWNICQRNINREAGFTASLAIAIQYFPGRNRAATVRLRYHILYLQR